MQKIIINESIFFCDAISILVISNHNSFRVLFDKIASVYFFEKYINILALEMASPVNRHCANCIGALSFPILRKFSIRGKLWKYIMASFHTNLR